jgi:gamma-glutamylcyclotransferase (GGCT)/AIG2-like uncharacterized protein YtfP
MDVFVYGTLTDPDRRAAVLGEEGEAFAVLGPARLRGLHRVGGRYPTLAPGGAVDGRLLRTDRVGALDRYERVEDGLYVRVSIPRPDPRGGRAAVYVGDPGRLDPAEPVEWPGEGSFEARVERYVREAGATVEGPD